MRVSSPESRRVLQAGVEAYQSCGSRAGALKKAVRAPDDRRVRAEGFPEPEERCAQRTI